MNRANKSWAAVLGLLGLGPNSGYGVRKELRDRVGPLWSESFGQIYPILRGLVDAGLAESLGGPGGNGRTRRDYDLTPAGRAALQSWISRSATAQPARDELLLKVILGRHLAPSECSRHLREHQDTLDARAQTCRALEFRLRSNPEPDERSGDRLLSLRLELLTLEARLTWCRETLVLLDQSAQYADPSDPKTSSDPRPRSDDDFPWMNGK